jgi:glycosyltransferase involved in cell wall biosynthesis
MKPFLAPQAPAIDQSPDAQAIAQAHAQPESDRRLLLFDLALGGHHGSYIRHLLDYWVMAGETDSANSDAKSVGIDIVVSPDFFRVHSDVVEQVHRLSQFDIQLLTITESEAATLAPRNSSWQRLWRNIQEWQLLRHYATKQKSTSALLLYLDTCELPMALGLAAPCPVSGIYFRPTFHYARLASDQHAPSRWQTHWQTHWQTQRQQWLLHRLLHHPQLQTLLCLDPFAAAELAQIPHPAEVAYLPDPVQFRPSPEAALQHLRSRLGIDPHRRVLLLFGALDGRKGIDQLLAAIALLPASQCESLCLLLVGGTSAREQERIRAKSMEVRQTHPIQLIEDYRFVAEAEVPAYFQLADLVLAPYQRHVGMSGILLLAAAAGKPVLSSNYGLMGELVRRHQLGIAVDSTQPWAIAQGLLHSLQTPLEELGDRTQMQQWAAQNSTDAYAATVFRALGLEFEGAIAQGAPV